MEKRAGPSEHCAAQTCKNGAILCKQRNHRNNNIINDCMLFIFPRHPAYVYEVSMCGCVLMGTDIWVRLYLFLDLINSNNKKNVSKKLFIFLNWVNRIMLNFNKFDNYFIKIYIYKSGPQLYRTFLYKFFNLCTRNFICENIYKYE